MPLASFRNTVVGLVRAGRHWLALKIGGHTAAIMQSGPRPFSWDRVTFRGHDDSFGESSPAGATLHFGTQHIITGQWVRLASRFGKDLACFLDPSPRSCHWLRFVIRLSASSEQGGIGFVRGKPPAGATLHFGTQHVRTGQWVRLGSRFGRDLACFLDPSPRTCHWLRFVIRLSASFEQGGIGFVWGTRCADAIGFVRGTRYVRSDASRRSVRIVKEQDTRGFPASSSGDAVSRVRGIR